MATVELTDANFAETINGGAMVIVDCSAAVPDAALPPPSLESWAPWCGPCRAFAPVYEQLSDKYPDIVFARINTEQEQVLAGHFQIRSIPTLMIFREQIIIFMQPGALPAAALERIIDKAQSLDMDQVRREIEAQQPEQNPANA